jgi:hypothetical protein
LADEAIGEEEKARDRARGWGGTVRGGVVVKRDVICTVYEIIKFS